ncbi:MAG: FxsA family protein [Deltaproteobacteria bacterium]|nr:FxsA family protein [Deltaproteobacteria bacterium]
MWWFVPVLILPFFELWSLLELGAVVGVWWTLAWCLAMVVLGVSVIRLGRQRMITALRRSEAAMWRAPWRTSRGAEGRELMQDGLLVLAGGLIAFPGVGSDVLGLVLLVPFLRRAIVGWARRLGARRAARPSRSPDTPVARDVEIYPPGSVRLPQRQRPVVIDVE